MNASELLMRPHYEPVIGMVNDKDDDIGIRATERYSLSQRDSSCALESWDTIHPCGKESIQPVRILRYAEHSNPDRVSSASHD